MRRSERHRAARAALVMCLAVLGIPLLGGTPVQAAAPIVLTFLPLSGDAGTSVTIVGSGFDDASSATVVAFNGTQATFSVGSDLTITATVPVGATSGPITVTDAEGTSSSLLSFTVGSGVPDPPPALTEIVPDSGAPGDMVQLIGTGLEDATGVDFNGLPATIVPGLDPLTAIVPDGVTSGPVSVTTPLGPALGLLGFSAKGDQAAPARHARTVSLAIHGKRARGRVRATDGFTDCVANVPVKIQRRGHHGWRTVAKARTNPKGRFERTVGKRHGAYRAMAPKAKVNGGADVCARRASGTRRT
jgi:hypothetical protein